MKRIPVPKFVLPSVSLFLALACGSESAPDSSAENSEYAQKTVDEAGGEISLSQAALVVPQGALGSTTEISLKAFSALEASELAEIPSGTIYAAEPIAFLPHGLSFETPVEIRLTYEERGTADYFVAKLEDEEDETWEEVPGAMFEDGTALVQVTSFSVYSVFQREEATQETGGSNSGGSSPDSTSGGASSGGKSSGGEPSSGGAPSTGGETSSGGAPGSGGALGSGGAATGGASSGSGGALPSESAEVLGTFVGYNDMQEISMKGYARAVSTGSGVSSDWTDSGIQYPLFCVDGALPAAPEEATSLLRVTFNEASEGTVGDFTPTDPYLLFSLETSADVAAHIVISDGTNEWCATGSISSGFFTHLWTDFNTACDGSGTAYQNEPLSFVEIRGVQSDSSQAFSYCVMSFNEGNLY